MRHPARPHASAGTPTRLLLPTALYSPLLHPKAAAKRPTALQPIILLLLMFLELQHPGSPAAAALP